MSSLQLTAAALCLQASPLVAARRRRLSSPAAGRPPRAAPAGRAALGGAQHGAWIAPMAAAGVRRPMSRHRPAAAHRCRNAFPSSATLQARRESLRRSDSLPTCACWTRRAAIEACTCSDGRDTAAGDAAGGHADRAGSSTRQQGTCHTFNHCCLVLFQHRRDHDKQGLAERLRVPVRREALAPHGAARAWAGCFR